jgi:hypothetical protein
MLTKPSTHLHLHLHVHHHLCISPSIKACLACSTSPYPFYTRRIPTYELRSSAAILTFPCCDDASTRSTLQRTRAKRHSPAITHRDKACLVYSTVPHPFCSREIPTYEPRSSASIYTASCCDNASTRSTLQHGIKRRSPTIAHRDAAGATTHHWRPGTSCVYSPVFTPTTVYD